MLPFERDWYSATMSPASEETIAASGWVLRDTGKAHIACNSQEDGDAVLTVTCEPSSGAEDCAFLLVHTLSWQPMGAVNVSMPDGSSHTIDAFATDWRAQGRKWTVLQHHNYQSNRAPRVPRGTSEVRVRCTGTSSAPAEMKSFYNRQEFRIHGFIAI